MKKLVSLLMVSVLCLLVAGCNVRENNAIELIRTSLNNINTQVEKGVTIESYHELLVNHSKVIKDVKDNINEKKREKDLKPLYLASVDYAIVLMLWIEQSTSEVAMENDIVILRDNMVPPEVNRMALAESSRLTIESVFKKSDGGRFAAAGAYVLPRRIAFSIYWCHAADLLKGETK